MLTRDRNDPSCYFNLVFFDSYEISHEELHPARDQASAEQFKVPIDRAAHLLASIFRDLGLVA